MEIAISRNPAKWFLFTYTPKTEGEVWFSGYIHPGNRLRPNRLKMPITDIHMVYFGGQYFWGSGFPYCCYWDFLAADWR